MTNHPNRSKIEKQVEMKAWRVFSNGEVTKGPVDAPSLASAMRLLDTRNLSNVQVIENACWVWAV